MPLPAFTAKVEQREGRPPVIDFKCIACPSTGAVDEATGLCLLCWRSVSLLAAVLAAIRAEASPQPPPAGDPTLPSPSPAGGAHVETKGSRP